MTIQELRATRKAMGMSQAAFADMLQMPFRTLQDWETGAHKAPQYVLDLIEFRVKNDPKFRLFLDD